MKNTMKKVLALLLALAMVLALAACSTSETKQDEKPAQNDQKAEAEQPSGTESTDETAKQASDLRIAGLIHVESYIGTMMRQGMEDAAKEYGVEMMITNYNGDTAKCVEAANTYVAAGVDAIVTSIDDTTAKIFEDAAAKGIKIACINAVMEDYDWMCGGYTYDQAGLGRGAVEYAKKFIRENLDGVANVHIIRVLKGSFADARGDAFMEGIQEEFGDNAKLVSESSTYITSEALQQATDAMTANPDINIIFCEGEDALMGAYAAVENTGNAGKVFVFGIDGNAQIAQYLLDPDNQILQATCAQDPYEFAYRGTKQAIEVCLGKAEPSTQRTFLTPVELNKGDLETVQAYYDSLVAASEK